MHELWLPFFSLTINSKKFFKKYSESNSKNYQKIRTDEYHRKYLNNQSKNDKKLQMKKITKIFLALDWKKNHKNKKE